MGARRRAAPRASLRRPGLSLAVAALGLAAALWIAGPFGQSPASATQTDGADGAEAAPSVSASVAVSVHASGLVNPRGIAAGPDGLLYVAEAGYGRPTSSQRTDPQARTALASHSARVSRVDRAGQVEVLVDQLPSFYDGQLDHGAADLAFLDDTLYLLTSAGGYEVGDLQFDNQLLSLESLEPPGSARTVFNLTEYNLARLGLSREQVRSWTEGTGGVPFALAALRGALYVSDSLQQHVTRITPDGRTRRLIQYPPSTRMLAGLTAGPDGALYLAELGEQPRDDANARIIRLGPGGTAQTFLDKLPDVLDLTFGSDGALYLLQSARPGARTPLNGQVMVIRPDGGREVLASGISFPSSLVVASDGELYVTSDGYSDGGGQGVLLKLEIAARFGPRNPLLEGVLAVLATVVVLVGAWLGLAIAARRALS
jgi:sugar lactone lactonase YvrE